MPLQGALVENVKFVQAFGPINTTGAGQDGAWVSMKGHKRLAIVLETGTWAGGTAAVTLEQCTQAADAGSDAKALAFDKYHLVFDADSTPDDVASEVAVTSNTFNLSDNANVIVIDVRAADLDGDNGFKFVRVRTATPGANADLVSGLYILHDGNFSGTPSQMPTALS